MSEVYCKKCGLFTREIKGDFRDGEGEYEKHICDKCNEVIKIRENEKHTTDEH